jgi:hypothetical protein
MNGIWNKDVRKGGRIKRKIEISNRDNNYFYYNRYNADVLMNNSI